MIKIDDYQTFVFDLDGTLFKNGTVLTERTIKMLQKLNSLNKKIIISTGRSGPLIHKVLQSLNFDFTLLSLNGHLGFDYNNWNQIVIKTFGKKVSHEVIKKMFELQIYAMIYVEKGMFFINRDLDSQRHSHSQRAEGMKNEMLENTLFKFVNNISELKDIDIIKLEIPNWFHSAATIEEFRRFLTNYDLDFFFSSPSYCEVMTTQTNKGIALQMLDKAGIIDLKTTIAFGDEVNDIEMAKVVNWFVALSNANPNLKKLANEETRLSNKEDGVADYLETKFKIGF